MKFTNELYYFIYKILGLLCVVGITMTPILLEGFHMIDGPVGDIIGLVAGTVLGCGYVNGVEVNKKGKQSQTLTHPTQPTETMCTCGRKETPNGKS